MATRFEVWLLGRMEAILMSLADRRWIGRANATRHLRRIDLRLAKISRRDRQ